MSEKNFPYVIGLILLIIVCTFEVIMMFHQVPDRNVDTVNQGMGFWRGVAVGAFISWIFGSTVSSRKKDETISSMTSTKEGSGS